MAAPTFKSVGSTTRTASVTTADATFPVSIAAGDLAFFVCRAPTGQTVSAGPSGFSALGSVVDSGGSITQSTCLYIGYKICNGTEGSTTVTATWSSATGDKVSAIVVYTGGRAFGTPCAQLGTTSNASLSTSLTWAAGTTTAAASSVLHLGAWVVNGGTIRTSTPGGSFTENADQGAVMTGATTSCMLLAESLVVASPGSVAATTSTASANKVSFAGMLIEMYDPSTSSSNLFFGSMF
jgi:hypothetical protein